MALFYLKYLILLNILFKIRKQYSYRVLNRISLLGDTGFVVRSHCRIKLHVGPLAKQVTVSSLSAHE